MGVHCSNMGTVELGSMATVPWAYIISVFITKSELGNSPALMQGILNALNAKF
jgi:hypothetical protein